MNLHNSIHVANVDDEEEYPEVLIEELVIPSEPLQTEMAEIENLPKIRIPDDKGSSGRAKCRSPHYTFRANSTMMSFSQTNFKKN